jgi:exodeoxyribonuclease V alpha subunit
MDDGHCGLPLNDLVAMAEQLLEIPASIVEEALDLELHAGEVVADEVDDRHCIFLAGLHRAERATVDRLRALQEGMLPWPRIDLAKAVPWVEARAGITLAESQRAALRLALLSKVLVITGGPGVGKTTLITRSTRYSAPRALRLRWRRALDGRRSGSARALAAPPRLSTGCSTSIPGGAASGATKRTRSGVICSSSTRCR